MIDLAPAVQARQLLGLNPLEGTIPYAGDQGGRPGTAKVIDSMALMLRLP
jgi:hypothetical protein